jgi:hypothetical protein
MPHQMLSADDRRHVPAQAPRPPQGSCRFRSAAWRDAIDGPTRWQGRPGPQGNGKAPGHGGDGVDVDELLMTALETWATRWRHAQREKTVEEGLRLLYQARPPEPPRTAPPPPVPPIQLGAPSAVPPVPPARHLLDGYAMAKYRRDLTLGSMTLNDWESIRGRVRASTQGQARFEAQVTLVVELAIAKHARGSAVSGGDDQRGSRPGVGPGR